MNYRLSIRRKLVFALGIVFLIVAVVAYNGIDGLSSYGEVVNDLDFSINSAARRSDLVAAVDVLISPLLVPAPKTADEQELRSFGRLQHAEFQKAITSAKEQLSEYERRLANMPQSPSFRNTEPVIRQFLGRFRTRLLRFEVDLSPKLLDPRTQSETAEELLREVVEFHASASLTPDPSVELSPKLEEARRIYRSRLRVVTVWSTCCLLFLCVLSYVGYRWILGPIGTLHAGARRVANGDFTHRVNIKTNDELSDLAQVFNRVVAQFHEINCDLDRKVREKTRELIRSERLAGVGFLAAGVAHEINNPLSAISMAAESLEGRASDLREQCESEDLKVINTYLSMIQRESERCRGITERLLSFARGQDAERAEANLTGLIVEVISMLEHLSKFRDREIIFHPDGPVSLVVNAAEIKQVVLNLLANALESTDSGGRVEVDLYDQPNRVDILIRDNGCGMTHEVLENLFDPFFTRRRSGQGTGLGLSISHRIIQDHGGSIEPSSEGPGKGSTFRIRLPKPTANTQEKRAA